jgi:transposase-like protein
MPASILEEVGHLLDAALTQRTSTRLGCPSRGSAHVAQVLGDNGGISYVCTACGHSGS